MEIKVYNDKNEVVKTAKAEPVEVRTGTIRKIMKIMKPEGLGDTAKFMQTVTDAWDDVTGVLSQCFPEMTEKDWDNTKLSEVVKAVLWIIKYTYKKIMTVPGDDEKN